MHLSGKNRAGRKLSTDVIPEFSWCSLGYFEYVKCQPINSNGTRQFDLRISWGFIYPYLHFLEIIIYFIFQATFSKHYITVFCGSETWSRTEGRTWIQSVRDKIMRISGPAERKIYEWHG